MKPTEFQIQRALCMWLDRALRPDVIYWHTPNGGARGAFEGKRFKETGVKAGIFDLTFVAGGAFWVLELKDETGVLSPAQEAMWKRYIAAGARGIAVANSLEAAKSIISGWMLTVYG